MNVEDEIYNLKNLVYGLMEQVSILKKENNKLNEELDFTKVRLTTSLETVRKFLQIYETKFKDLDKVLKMGKKLSELEKDFKDET